MLLVLGFRTLRRENAPLGWCYRLSLAALLLRGTAYVLLSLPVELDKTLAYCTSLVTLALYICLWRGMVGVSRSAGAEKPAAPAAGAMAVLYGLLLPLAYIGLEGWLLRRCSWPERAVLILIAPLMLYPGTLTDLVGFVLLVLLLAGQRLFRRPASPAPGNA